MLDRSRAAFGKYRGSVVDNLDPSNLGRLKVRVPGVLGDQTMWALPCVPYAGAGSGVYLVPEPDTGVWVEFEAGDISRPIWSGCWWGEGQLPADEEGAVTAPHVRLIRSEKALIIELDDSDQRITLSGGSGGNQITIEVQPGVIKIKGETKVIVDAPQVELGGNVSQPLVLGGELLQYLNQLVAIYNTHLHPGEFAMNVPVTPAPPVPPLPPATPQMLSNEVKTG